MRLLTALVASALFIPSFADDEPEDDKPEHSLLMHGGCTNYHNEESGYRQPMRSRIQIGIYPACEWLEGAIGPGEGHYYDTFDVQMGMGEGENYDPLDRPIGDVRLEVLNVSEDKEAIFTHDMCFHYFVGLMLQHHSCIDGWNRTTIPTPLGYEIEHGLFHASIMMVEPELAKPYDPATRWLDKEKYPWK